MGTVTRHGRDFEFDDGVSPEVQDRRIRNWMQEHAPDELKGADEPKDGIPNALKMALSAMGPVGALSGPGIAAATGDKGSLNYLRTLVQGALPFSDEIIAGARSLAGTPYDQALSEERQGLKDYEADTGLFGSMATQGLGAAMTLPLTMAGGAALNLAGRAGQIVPSLAKLASKYPTIARYLGAGVTGGTLGGIGGFGAGEGDFGSRMENATGAGAVGAALGPVALAAVGAGDKAFQMFKPTVGKYLRGRMENDLGSKLARVPGIPKTAAGEVDVEHPDFKEFAANYMYNELKNRRATAGAAGTLMNTPMAADLMPGTTEAVSQYPGKGSKALSDELIQRQFDKNLGEASGRGLSQYGRLEDMFDWAFGPDNMRLTDKALVERRKTAANTMFQPAYAKNIRSADLEKALNDPYVSDAWKPALKEAASEGRAPGLVNPVSGNISTYNTEFLHSVKRHMDSAIAVAEDKSDFNTARIIRDAKNKLNNAIMDANPEYKAAMQHYGEESERIGALQKGYEDMLDKPAGVKGKSPGDLEEHLADTAVPQELRDLYRLGAARGAREQLLLRPGIALTHNSAKFVNQPNVTDRMKAIMPADAWDKMRKQLVLENEGFKTMSGALGNSRTAAREALKEEMASGPGALGDLAGVLANPSAPSSVRHSMLRIMGNANPQTRIANQIAPALAGRGAAGNRASVQRLYDILAASDARSAAFNRMRNVAPYAMGVNPMIRQGEQQP